MMDLIKNFEIGVIGFCFQNADNYSLRPLHSVCTDLFNACDIKCIDIIIEPY